MTATTPLFVWKDAYNIDVGLIDTQHCGLVRLINTLHGAMAAGKARESLSRILDELVDYTKTHFAAEEGLMRLHSFPMKAGHKLLHDKFTQTIVDFRRDFRAGRVTLSLPLMEFLKTWLVEHIQHSDQELAVHLRRLNIC